MSEKSSSLPMASAASFARSCSSAVAEGKLGGGGGGIFHESSLIERKFERNTRNCKKLIPSFFLLFATISLYRGIQN